MRQPILSVLLACALGAGPGWSAPPQTPGQAALSGLIPLNGRPVNFDNSARIRDLLRAGTLYLSLADALALAIENNLDVEIERDTLAQASTDAERAAGGGNLRGLNYTVVETPAGVGGPLSLLATSPANPTGPSGSTVAASAIELGVLGEPQDNVSVQGPIAQSNGTAVPSFDPSLIGSLGWGHYTTPEVDLLTYGVNVLTDNAFTANTGIQQGFSTGATASLSFSNTHNSLNALNIGYNPYTSSSLALNVTQPLLRGFGRGLNRRFIRMAVNQQRVGSLLFQTQLNVTVYGVIRLYTDFVALFEDEKVKEETVKLANELLANTTAQVQEGTLAQVELTRAKAQVFSTQQDLISARGLREEQEAILKNVLTRDQDLELRSARIIPTDTLEIPEKDDIQPIQDLLAFAVDHRPDLGQARVQVDNSLIGLQGSRDAVRPEVDLVGTMQNSGLAGPLTGFVSNPNPQFGGGYGSVLGQVLARDYPTYAIGLQVTVPLRNRVAESDLARDELQVKQSQIRVKQIENQVKLEVQDALIGMRRSRESYVAAVEARKLQQESLDDERAKFDAGASTAFFVIQYESLLAQARSTEVAAKSSYVKARAALSRALGSILGDNHISVEAAARGSLR